MDPKSMIFNKKLTDMLEALPGSPLDLGLQESLREVLIRANQALSMSTLPELRVELDLSGRELAEFVSAKTKAHNLSKVQSAQLAQDLTNLGHDITEYHIGDRVVAYDWYEDEGRVFTVTSVRRTDNGYPFLIGTKAPTGESTTIRYSLELQKYIYDLSITEDTI